MPWWINSLLLFFFYSQASQVSLVSFQVHPYPNQPLLGSWLVLPHLSNLLLILPLPLFVISFSLLSRHLLLFIIVVVVAAWMTVITSPQSDRVSMEMTSSVSVWRMLDAPFTAWLLVLWILLLSASGPFTSGTRATNSTFVWRTNVLNVLLRTHATV